MHLSEKIIGMQLRSLDTLILVQKDFARWQPYPLLSTSSKYHLREDLKSQLSKQNVFGEASFLQPFIIWTPRRCDGNVTRVTSLWLLLLYVCVCVCCVVSVGECKLGFVRVMVCMSGGGGGGGEFQVQGIEGIWRASRRATGGESRKCKIIIDVMLLLFWLSCLNKDTFVSQH